MKTPKDCGMCPKEKVVDECRECMEGIQQDASVVLHEIKEDLKKEFKETQAEMKNEWIVFLEGCKASNNAEKRELEQQVDKRDKSSMGLVKFVMAICLALCLACVSAIAYNSGKISSLTEQKADKTQFEQYLTIRNAKELNDIREAYYKQLFLLNDKNEIDSTNYNWVVSHYLSEPTRGSDKFYRSDYIKQQNKNLLNK